MEIQNEQKEKLEAYQKLLHKWQDKINLVSSKTLGESWKRHFEDSIQIQDYVPLNSKVGLDLGSGAGFPGMVLAILNPNIQMNLVESDHKKCVFIHSVSRETLTDVNVINERIEAVDVDIIPDFITARALAPLDKLFNYCEKWILANPKVRFIFPKGRNFESELEILQNDWTYDLSIHPSKIEDDSHILLFSHISRL
ncbi:MAG: 16S rRNA (guanine(527)-N(7))-methyltransferase RsmG [Pseudomonadota bacterium]